MKKLLILILLILPLSGCYNYLEINDMEIVEAVGIDYHDELYSVTLQILNINQDNAETPIIYTEEDNTIGKAIRKISLKAPNQLYFGHLSLIILGKEMSEFGISTSYEIFLRDPLIRSDAYVLIASDDTAYNILNQKLDTTVFPTDAIINSLKNSSQKDGLTKDLLFDELVAETMEKGLDATISTIYIESVDSNKQTISQNNIIKLGPLAVIKDDKVRYILTEEESRTLNIINNNFEDIMISIEYENSINNIDITLPKSKIDLNIDNEKIKAIINIDLDGDVTELKQNSDAEKRKVLEGLEKSLENKLKSMTLDLIKTLKAENIDALGLKNIIYKHYYSKYEKYKDINIYDITEFEINIDTEIYEVGNTYEGFK
ncbi:MAG TPA: Ger(x)C family spore germination protein [Bacilli bacterium]|nr:Ger(x)C family spore germination protein [Bacilli bacterium]